jgi:hypothetical protein
LITDPQLLCRVGTEDAVSAEADACYKETPKGEGRKGEEIKQETERHMQGADPSTQADTEADEQSHVY